MSIVDTLVGLEFLVVASAIVRREDLDVSTVDTSDGSGLGAGETDTRADVVGCLERVHPPAGVVADLKCVFGIGDTGACDS